MRMKVRMYMMMQAIEVVNEDEYEGENQGEDVNDDMDEGDRGSK